MSKRVQSSRRCFSSAQMGLILLLLGFAMLAHAGYSTIQCESLAYPAALLQPPFQHARHQRHWYYSTSARLHSALTLSALCAAHTAAPSLSSLPDRKYLRMVDQDFNGSPYDVHIECAIGFLLCLVGCVSYADDLKPIRLAQTFHEYGHALCPSLAHACHVHCAEQ